MFVLGNLVITIAQLVSIILTALYWLILVRALISWVSPDPYNPIVRFLYQVTEPILEPIRRFLPVSGIDFSPLVAFLAIFVLRSFLVQTLFDIGSRLKY
ncbi:MAG: YggT family protein [Candidatus Omnitrophica bacterium]|nr:YggT family protein [Candidatus Omnitrophota bacterium]